MTDFALTLKAARAERNLSQAQLAYVSGVSEVTLSHIESGKVRPQPGTKEKIEEALQLSVHWEKTFDQGRVRRQVLTN